MKKKKRKYFIHFNQHKYNRGFYSRLSVQFSQCKNVKICHAVLYAEVLAPVCGECSLPLTLFNTIVAWSDFVLLGKKLSNPVEKKRDGGQDKKVTEEWLLSGVTVC